MTNMFLVVLTFWFLESSQGKFLTNEHAAGGRGHLQQTSIFVQDVNRIAGHEKYRLSDRYDKHKSFEMARTWLRYYLPKKWTIDQAALIWRYGPKGSKRIKRPWLNSYVLRARREYKRLTMEREN